MGRGVLGFAKPTRLRPLFPLLVAPDVASVPASVQYYGPRWVWYQTLRLCFIWAALWVDATYMGLTHSVICAGLFGLTLRYDYWSNSVELLAACLVVAASHGLGIPWVCWLVVGFGLGLGRETLPLLAFAGAWPIAAGAAAAQSTLRIFTRTDPEWASIEKVLQHGFVRLKHNFNRIVRPENAYQAFPMYVFCVLGALAGSASPALTIAVVGTTLIFSRIDEPRVLTMLIPFAASAMCP